MHIFRPQPTHLLLAMIWLVLLVRMWSSFDKALAREYSTKTWHCILRAQHYIAIIIYCSHALRAPAPTLRETNTDGYRCNLPPAHPRAATLTSMKNQNRVTVRGWGGGSNRQWGGGEHVWLDVGPPACGVGGNQVGRLKRWSSRTGSLTNLRY